MHTLPKLCYAATNVKYLEISRTHDGPEMHFICLNT